MKGFKQLEMDGKTFNECWVIDNVSINENDNVLVNFHPTNGTMINVFVNNKKVWSIINSLR